MPFPLAHPLLWSGKGQEYKALQAQEGLWELLEVARAAPKCFMYALKIRRDFFTEDSS